MATNNKYFWNQTLKFSWAHIVTFVALIFLSYVAYMGEFYRNGGSFLKAALTVGLVDVAILVTFIGAQILKGTDSKFRRKLRYERLLMILCPVAFVCAMVPYNHFWDVYKRRAEIESHFKTAITDSKQMFDEYRAYCLERTGSYRDRLDWVVAHAGADRQLYKACGFDGTNDQLLADSYVKALDLQLMSPATVKLIQSATEWVNNADQGVTVWNAFLVGNISQIKQAMARWHSLLEDNARPVLTNERAFKDSGVKPFDPDRLTMFKATQGLNALSALYRETTGLSMTAVLSGIVIFFMLLLPYLLQQRNLRAQGYYSLFGLRGRHKAEGELTLDDDTPAVAKPDQSFGITMPETDEKPKGKDTKNKPSKPGGGLYGGTITLGDD